MIAANQRGEQPRSAPGEDCRAEPPAEPLTEIDLIWHKGRHERWLRFGRIAAARIVDRDRRIVSLAPGGVVALIRWRGNAYGTTSSRIDILRTLAPGRAGVLIPGVSSPAYVLLRLSGWPKVERALAAIDAVEAGGLAPEGVCPDHWRQVHGRLTVNRPPEAYTPARHRAWQLRRAVER